MSSQAAFRALADPTRREILTLLSKGEMTVQQVSDEFQFTRAAIKKHLVILEQGGLLVSRRSGRETFNALNPEGFAPVTDWLSYFNSFWDDKLSALSDALTTPTPNKKDS